MAEKGVGRRCVVKPSSGVGQGFVRASFPRNVNLDEGRCSVSRLFILFLKDAHLIFAKAKGKPPTSANVAGCRQKHLAACELRSLGRIRVEATTRT